MVVDHRDQLCCFLEYQKDLTAFNVDNDGEYDISEESTDDDDDYDDDDDDYDDMSEEEIIAMMKELEMGYDDDDDDLIGADDLQKLLDSANDLQDETTNESNNIAQLASGTPTDAESNNLPATMDEPNAMTAQTSSVQSLSSDPDLAGLQMVLPGMPKPRLKQIKKAFQESLAAPSLLTLVPILRENMPEQITPTWLMGKNLRDADFCIAKAHEDGAINIHMLNTMLQVASSTGGIDRALYLRDVQFQNYGLVRL